MKVLRNTRGASLMFVLAITFLLLAIGMSTITAAGMTLGVTAAQRHRSQLEIYVSSMERVLKEAIEQDESLTGLALDSIGSSKTMVGLILYDVLKKAIPEGAGTETWEGYWMLDTASNTISLPSSLEGDPLVNNVGYEVRVAWDMSVRVPELERCVRHSIYEYDDEGNPGDEIDFWIDPCILFEVEVNGYITVTITTTYTTPSDSKLSMRTVMEYRLDEEVIIAEGNDPPCTHDPEEGYEDECGRPNTISEQDISKMQIQNLPARSLEKHEKTRIT